MSGHKPLIYAELLSNIRQISIIAALDTPCDASTKATLSSNSQQIILNHGGETTTLDLPGKVAANAQLQKPALGKKELSWRLPVAGAFTREDVENAQSIEGPWSAKSLGEDSEFYCRSCDAAIIERGSIKTWKDLPSDNWAEMMDFWHCHKPDDNDHDHDHQSNSESGHANSNNAEDSNVNRGYGANTKFVARPGTAFVNLTTFLLTNFDCLGLQVRYCVPFYLSFMEFLQVHGYQEGGHALLRISVVWPPIQLPKIDNLFSFCTFQQKILDETFQVEAAISAVTLFPPPIRITFYLLNHFDPTLQYFASAMLFTGAAVADGLDNLQYPPSELIRQIYDRAPSLIGAICLFIFRIHPFRNLNDEFCFYLILLAYGLLSIHIDMGLGVRFAFFLDELLAMKVFWTEVTEEAAVKLAENAAVEELSLPVEAVQELSACLRDSAALLPPSARKFQEWDEKYKPLVIGYRHQIRPPRIGEGTLGTCLSMVSPHVFVLRARSLQRVYGLGPVVSTAGPNQGQMAMPMSGFGASH
ncbi:hypothetical protein G7Y89_g1546 [Cudoniella acicularis]|uniref:Uncharacterized protein n=1 Tax=Cudoniella acicularis TaxID=354080 RepID=A0A8H4W7A9_9HELO|nr:hypothetical protein G7Y89_g1546 [Cudoniella acicularis]